MRGAFVGPFVRTLSTTASKKRRVLFVGLAPEHVNYEKWPDLTPEKLRAGLAGVIQELNDAGHTATPCFTDTGATAADVLSAELTKGHDIVLIGAGVRTDPDHFLLFENMINIIHRQAPDATLCFNTNPFDSLDAVNRSLQ